MRTMHVQIRLTIVPQSVHPDYPPRARVCMLLCFCNNYGPMVYLVRKLISLSHGAPSNQAAGDGHGALSHQTARPVVALQL